MTLVRLITIVFSSSLDKIMLAKPGKARLTLLRPPNNLLVPESGQLENSDKNRPPIKTDKLAKSPDKRIL